MKWIGLILILAAVAPISWWLRARPIETKKALMAMGFLPFVVPSYHLYMDIITWPGWPGYVHGFEYTALDSLALAVYISLPAKRSPVPFRAVMALYFVTALLSVLQAEEPIGALFYPWQLGRMYLVYVATARACTDLRIASSLLQGLGAGLIFEAGLTIWQRFGLGILQAYGNMPAQNFLGMVSLLVVFPFFAVLLSKRSGWFPVLVIISGGIVAVLTTSRATAALSALGYGVIFALSALHRWTRRKALVLSGGVVLAALLVPLSLMSFEQRFADQGPSDYDERAVFETVAKNMLSDHPWGIGANHYTTIANSEGYNKRAGVAPIWPSLSAKVHNLYLLVAAETGYAGLVALVLLLSSTVFTTLRCGWQNRSDPRGELLIGVGIGFLMVCIQSFVEWVLVDPTMQYIFVLELGLVAGLFGRRGGTGAPNRRVHGLASQGAEPDHILAFDRIRRPHYPVHWIMQFRTCGLF